MARNRRTPGIILRSRRFGEYHKSLDILSPQDGVFNATAYGALKGKSRLAGVSEPFTEGEMYLYHDPVRDRIKLSEVDPTNRHDGIRESLRPYYIASFWVEFVIKSYAGGGEFASLYTLFRSALSMLEETRRYEAVTIHFIWRYLDLIGFRPDIAVCPGCGGRVGPWLPLYLEDTAFLCGGCADTEAARLNGWGRAFLERSARTSFARIESFLDEADGGNGEEVQREVERLKATMLHLVQDIVERPLNTLKQGMV